MSSNGPHRHAWFGWIAAVLVVPALHSATADETPAQPDAVERLQLNEVIYRDRDSDYGLQAAQRELNAGRTSAALELLQRLLDQGADSFQWDETTGELTRVRQQLAEIFGRFSPAQLQAYERLAGREARHLLDDIQLRGRRELLASFIRRFYYTSAGFAAVDWQATQWMDRGEHRRAARWWNRLCSDSAHAARVTPEILLKAAAANRLAGRDDQSNLLLSQLARRDHKLGGHEVDAVNWVQELAATPPATSTVDEWFQLNGDASRNAVTSGSPPALDASWSAPLHTANPRHQWDSAELDLTANFPLIVGRQLIVRDRRGITGRQLASGELLWRYDSPFANDNWRSYRTYDDQGRPKSASETAQISDRFHSFLASDGARLFAVELQAGTTDVPDAAEDAFALEVGLKFSTRLVAFDIHNAPSGGQSRAPLWIAGAAGSHQDDPLAGHTILGAPVPAGGIVYLMTEYDRQINLVALAAQTGELLWSQGIALMQQPVWFPGETDRLLAGYTPAIAEGIVVCPTAAGMLVAVEALTGDLLWARYYGEPPEQRIRRVAATRKRRWQHEPILADAPHVHGRTIVYLPSDSAYVHAFDLPTGRTLWKKPRDDAEYVGTITSEVTLLVGERRVQGLSTTTGEPAWKAPLRVELPAGRGVCLGATYLLPLKSGAVIQIELESGETIGVPFLRAELAATNSNAANIKLDAASMQTDPRVPYGNLVAGADVIVALGPQRVSVYPQAAELLARLQKQSRSQNGDEHQLQIAELQMLVGDEAAAGKTLTAWLDSDSAPAERQRAETLLRELIYYRLDRHSGDSAELLARLDRLSRTPVERGRYLVRLVAHDLSHERRKEVLQSLDRFAALDDIGLFPQPEDGRLRLSGDAWIASIRRKLLDDFSEEERAELFRLEQRQSEDILRGGDLRQLNGFLSGRNGSHAAQTTKTALARQFHSQGEFQRAELLLLDVLAHSPETHVEARARQLLAELWSQAGLHEEAGHMLAELERRCPDARLDGDQSVTQYLDSFDPNSLTWLAYRRRVPLDWSVSRIAIDEHRWLGGDPRLADVYNTRRAGFLSPDASSFDLLNAGRRGETRLGIANRATGTLVGEIDMPEGWRYPHWARYQSIGHFIPIGSNDSIHGLSLLEHENEIPIWSRSLASIGGADHGEVHVGPAGPGYAIFQSKRGQVLTAVDPATGRVLWQRSDLEPDSGLFGSPQLGLFGDADVLVSFEKDGKNHTVYRTRTGEEVRRGRLEIDPHYKPFTRGRRLLYYAALAGGRRLQIWNAVSNRVEFDEPFLAGHSAENEQTGELAILDQVGGRFRILDLEAGRKRIDVRLAMPPAATLRSIRFFDDAERYYVNFQTITNPPGGNFSWVPDTYLPKEDVLGELYAIRKADGQVLWHRTLPQRSILRFPDYPLPFLVALARSGPSRLLQQGSSRRFGTVPARGNGDNMLVEVIDARTGALLARREHVLSDRLVLSHFDRDAGLLQLFGIRCRLDFKFDRARQRPYWGDEPL